MYQTPVLFIVFNRPDVAKQVFEAIRAIKPAKLYIAADGPRVHREGEAKLCEETRKVTENIDWPCEVYRKYSDQNLGCKKGVSSAITWFFDNVEEGVILEDDCLPDPSFFSFCEELLSKYRNTEKVKMISGDNFQFGKMYGDVSYYFSNFPHIWGWATWRRAWQEYDIEMKSYPDFKKNNRIAQIFKDKKMQKYWLNLFDKLYANKIDTWDGQLVYSIYDNNGITILPNVNLVSNIGFGGNATHTKTDDIFSKMPTGTISKIIHPDSIMVNKEADKNYSSFLVKNIFVRIFRKLKSLLG
ncbi:MAG TPA: nucleotide-diphospho-sugar transferase [Candidatus Yonathbacteria bacterium]|nr:nucleotide-diphospho-sugar transferase [Candidatus Yonathbacteria bacterium]